jgi:hypothetical protein
MRKHLQTFALAGIAIFATACVTSPDVVFVDSGPGGDLVRLGRDVKGHVFYKDATTGNWTRSANRVHLPAGWYAGALPKEDAPAPD